MQRAPLTAAAETLRRTGSRRDEDITLASRFECKYVVSPMQVPGLRQFIEPFLRPDPFAAQHADFRYPICSLYLDSDDLRLYQQTVGGHKNRFKLRVRSYSDDPARAVFLEVKTKVNSIVRKRRARLERSRARALLAGGDSGWIEELDAGLQDDVAYFTHHVRLAHARPVVRVKYYREAYESRGGDPVRLTIDTELMHVATLDHEWSHAQGRWVGTPLDGVIVELKFTERYPAWMADLVRCLGMKQIPVPKYALSLDHLLQGGRETALAIAGFVLPPRRI
jgi:hypothetical protein